MRGMCLIVLLVLAGLNAAVAADLKDKVKVEISSVGLQPGMEPGMYVCPAGHLHIKGTVQNLADVPLGQITVAGKVFSSDGKLLGTATVSTRAPVVRPSDKVEFILEFLTVTGPKIQQVEKYELAVVEVSQKPHATSPMNPCASKGGNPCAAKGGM
jgi:hypothetical protein